MNVRRVGKRAGAVAMVVVMLCGNLRIADAADISQWQREAVPVMGASGQMAGDEALGGPAYQMGEGDLVTNVPLMPQNDAVSYGDGPIGSGRALLGYDLDDGETTRGVASDDGVQSEAEAPSWDGVVTDVYDGSEDAAGVLEEAWIAENAEDGYAPSGLEEVTDAFEAVKAAEGEYYISPDENYIVVRFREQLIEDAASGEMLGGTIKDQRGETVGVLDEVYGGTDLGDYMNVQLYYYFSRDPLIGDYDLYVTLPSGEMKVGTVHVVEEVVVGSNSIAGKYSYDSVLKDGMYDNGGNFIYLYVNGAGISRKDFYPVLMDETGNVVTEYTGIRLTGDKWRDSYTYQLKKLGLDGENAFWTSTEATTLSVGFSIDVIDVRSDSAKAVSYSLDTENPFLYGYYDSKKNKYIMTLKKRYDIPEGTEATVKMFKSQYVVDDMDVLATATGTVVDQKLELTFVDPSGAEYVPSDSVSRCFKYSFGEPVNKEYTCYGSWEQDYWGRSSGSASGTRLYTASPVAVSSSDTTIPLSLRIYDTSSYTPETEVIATLNGVAIPMAAGEKKENYIVFDGTYSGDALQEGVYKVKISKGDVDIGSWSLTSVGSGFVMSNQRGDFFQSDKMVYVSVTSESAMLDYAKKYPASSPTGAEAKAYWEEEGYDISFSNANGEGVDAKLDHVRWYSQSLYVYYTIPSGYAGLYAKVTKNGEVGRCFTSEDSYYTYIYRHKDVGYDLSTNDAHGVYIYRRDGFNGYYVDYNNQCYVGFYAGGKNSYPIEMTFTKPCDPSFMVGPVEIQEKDLTDGGWDLGYYFTEEDLASLSRDEVYTLHVTDQSGNCIMHTYYFGVAQPTPSTPTEPEPSDPDPADPGDGTVEVSLLRSGEIYFKNNGASIDKISSFKLMARLGAGEVCLYSEEVKPDWNWNPSKGAYAYIKVGNWLTESGTYFARVEATSSGKEVRFDSEDFVYEKPSRIAAKPENIQWDAAKRRLTWDAVEEDYFRNYLCEISYYSEAEDAYEPESMVLSDNFADVRSFVGLHGSGKYEFTAWTMPKDITEVAVSDQATFAFDYESTSEVDAWIEDTGIIHWVNRSKKSISQVWLYRDGETPVAWIIKGANYLENAGEDDMAYYFSVSGTYNVHILLENNDGSAPETYIGEDYTYQRPAIQCPMPTDLKWDEENMKVSWSPVDKDYVRGYRYVVINMGTHQARGERIMIGRELSSVDLSYLKGLGAGRYYMILSAIPNDVTKYVSSEDAELEFTYSGGNAVPTVTYTVSFYSRDVKISEETVTSGETVTNLPEMDESFISWIDDATGKRWNPTAPITRDLTLKARFRAEGQKEIPERSGRDTGLHVVTLAEEDHVYMVKGQSYAFEAKDESGKPITWKVSDSGKGVIKIASKYKAKVNGTTDPSVGPEGDTGVYVYNGASETDYVKRYTVHVIDPYLVTVTGSGDEEKTEKTPKTLTLLKGEAASLRPATEASAQWQEEYAVSWTTSNAEIAKVDDGLVYPLSKGTAKITAYVNGKALTVSVKVVDVLTPGKLQDDADVALMPLQTVSIKFADSSFKMKNLVWNNGQGQMVVSMKGKKVSFYQDDVVRVTPAGKMTAVAPGTTTLTAKTPDGKVKSLTVTVKRPVNAIVYINKGKSKALKFYNVKNAKVKWEAASDNAFSIAGDLNANKGKAKGLTAGIAKIKGTYAPYSVMDINGRTWGAGLSYTATVYVEDPMLPQGGDLTGFNKAMTSAKLSLDKGSTSLIQLQNVYQPVLFSSSKPDVAFMDDYGVVQARAKGKANLTARVNGKKFTIAVTVN